MSWIFVEWGGARLRETAQRLGSSSLVSFQIQNSKSENPYSVPRRRPTSCHLTMAASSWLVELSGALSSSIGRDTSFRTTRSHQELFKTAEELGGEAPPSRQRIQTCTDYRVAWRSSSALPTAPSSVRFSSPPLEVGLGVHGCHGGASNGQCHHLPAPQPSSRLSIC